MALQRSNLINEKIKNIEDKLNGLNNSSNDALIELDYLNDKLHRIHLQAKRAKYKTALLYSGVAAGLFVVDLAASFALPFVRALLGV